MKIRYFVPVAITATTIAIAQSVPAAQAATLGGSGLCANVDSSFYIDCAGSFDGNDKGSKGTAIENLDNLFGAGWTFAGDSDSDNLVSVVYGNDDQSGTATTSLSGAGAIAVKAGKSYSLYRVADLSSFQWSTAGVKSVGKGNTPGLSHISVYQSPFNAQLEAPQEVPEPSLMLGLVGLVGLGTRLKKRD